jgi:hypothetical protein
MFLRLRKINPTSLKAGDEVLVLRSAKYDSVNRAVVCTEFPVILEQSADGDPNSVYKPVQIIG